MGRQHTAFDAPGYFRYGTDRNSEGPFRPPKESSVDLRYSESDEKFRSELRAWLAEAVPAHGHPPAMNDWEARRVYDTGWQRKLFDAGYAGVNWPKAYGGREASLTEQLVYYEEIARAKAPYIGVNFVGMLHGGPTIIVEGSDAQKAAHIPRILKRRGGVVPGLLGADRRLRPREPANPRRPRRRPLRRLRPQDLDVLRPVSPTSASCSCAPIPNVAEAQGGISLADHAHGPRRASRSAHCKTLIAGEERVQRGLPRERAHPGREHASARRTTAGASPT